MSGDSKTRIGALAAPYGREIWLDDLGFDSGMHLLRVTIKEGRRFTQIDLDAATAAEWGKALLAWSDGGRRG